MVMAGFKIPEEAKKAGHKKARPVTLSKYLRTLFLMWLEGRIVVTEEDLLRYDK